MCEPVTIGTLSLTAAQSAMAGMVALTAVSTGASMYGQRQSAKAQVSAINQQNKVQAEEIARKSGLEMTERAREARRERATARVLAGEAGINLGSGSFLATLQASAMNQYNDMGLIVQNEKSQQAARAVNARSMMSSVQMPSWGEIALGTGLAAGQAYIGGKAMFDKGAAGAPGGP
jgi:hypothetical protein